MGLEKYIAEWTSRRVDLRGPKLLFEPLITRMLGENAADSNVLAALPPGTGGASITPFYLAPPATGYTAELSPMTTPDTVSSPSFPSSSPSSSSLVSSRPSPIQEIPASLQPHCDGLVSTPESRTSSATPNSSFPHNTEYSAASCLNTDDVNSGTPAEQWAHEARPHRHVPAIPSGFLGVPRSKNRPFPIHQPLGGYAPHVRYVDTAITVDDSFYRRCISGYGNQMGPIQSDNFSGNQRPQESLRVGTRTISGPIPTVFGPPFPAVPNVPRIVLSTEPHCNESNADCVVHAVGMGSTARQCRPAQSAAMVVQSHQPPASGPVPTHGTRSTIRTVPSYFCAQILPFTTCHKTTVLIFSVCLRRSNGRRHRVRCPTRQSSE